MWISARRMKRSHAYVSHELPGAAREAGAGSREIMAPMEDGGTNLGALLAHEVASVIKHMPPGLPVAYRQANL